MDQDVFTCEMLSESSMEILENTPTTSTGDPQDVDGTEDIRVPFPVAIVGMAIRLPGGVSCDRGFWDPSDLLFLTPGMLSRPSAICKQADCCSNARRSGHSANN